MPAMVIRVIRVVVWCRQLVSGLDLESRVALDWLLYKQEESQVSGLVSRIWLLYKQEKNLESGVAIRCQRLVSGSGSMVLRQDQGLGSIALPSCDRAVVVRTSDRVEVQGAQLYLVGEQYGASGRVGVWQVWRVQNQSWYWSWSRKKKKKSGLDTSKTLHRESAIALRYRRRLAGGASNPNVTKTTYYMRTLDKQALDSQN